MTDAMLAKPWLTQYPSSIPAEIDVSAYANLAEMLEAALTKYADRVAFHCSGTDVTYRELERLSTAFAAYSRQRHGAPDRRVALDRARSPLRAMDCAPL